MLSAKQSVHIVSSGRILSTPVCISRNCKARTICTRIEMRWDTECDKYLNGGNEVSHIRYNPFTKPLGEFSPDELGLLRDVAEGWFVDYKSGPISAKDFGKHLSAFANQAGGWLFVGVSEGTQKSLRAGSFPGIPTSDVSKTLVSIREGVSAHVFAICLLRASNHRGPCRQYRISIGTIYHCNPCP